MYGIVESLCTSATNVNTEDTLIKTQESIYICMLRWLLTEMQFYNYDLIMYQVSIYRKAELQT